MATGMLNAFIIPMPAGHTYVISDKGHIWPCHGRSSGGRLICGGLGNVDEAACLAQPDTEAGIEYLNTGLCHQIANRILVPSNLTVFSGAPTLRALSFLYGVYGLDSNRHACSPAHNPWYELNECRSFHNHP